MRTHDLARILLAAAAGLAALSCSTVRQPEEAPPVARAPAAAQAPAAGIPDDELGLDKADVTETSTPAPTRFDDSAPGERPLVPRAYEGEPPRVSHGVEDFLPITTDENMCVTCHGVEEKLEGGPTPIPSSHYTDLRNEPDAVGDAVVGARWVCTTCHVAQTGAAPLVENRFGS